jgi:glutamate-ammonia-ligase adenylyltransferase
MASSLDSVRAYSGFARRILDAHPELADWLADTLDAPFARAAMEGELDAAPADEAALNHALRVLRRRVVLKVLARDLTGRADLAEVCGTMTALAEVCVARALDFHHARLAERHGAPLNPDGSPMRMVVVGMGKLGGGELNVSSDIDPIFLYPEEGETQPLSPSPSPRGGGEQASPSPSGEGAQASPSPSGGGVQASSSPSGEGAQASPSPSGGGVGERVSAKASVPAASPSPPGGGAQPRGPVGERAATLSHHEFFTRLGRKLIATLGETTADGFVFRVDMRLRPWGESGPLATSFEALESYLVTHGRPWERLAWIKARPFTGERHAELEAIVRPFVFRKYLDHGAFASMRELHAQIRREVARRELSNNVKLGPGGIREIEFIAQVFQLIRGGREPRLTVRGTQAALPVLGELGLLPPDAVRGLLSAYRFLRNVEHRLQYREDAQTHALPDDAADLDDLARAMNFPSRAAFLAELKRQRDFVARQFDQVFAAPQSDQSAHPLAALGSNSMDNGQALALLANAGFADGPETLRRLNTFRAAPRTQALPEASRARLTALLPPLVEVAGGMPNPDATLARLLDILEAIRGRAAYLALLVEYPGVLRQLAKLVSASPWAAEQLARHPLLLDELIDARALLGAPDWPALAAQLRAQLDATPGDTEACMDALRRFKHTRTLHLLAQDLAGLLTVETLSDHLAALADLLLAQTLRLAWSDLPGRHRDAPAFAVVGYGKLGGKEMGYASDLDIVFLYDDPAPEASEAYARLAKRINNWLTTHTGTGTLYDTDLRLRPDGLSGLLVSGVEAYLDYQSHHAWTWEHQALTRARFVCGDAAVGTAFEAIRREVLCLPRDTGKLREDVLAMRQRMHDGHRNPTALFDIKHDAGGVVDVEFCVQYLILAHAREHTPLLDNVGNIALLKRCAGLGLLPEAIALPAADAYRELRRAQHRVKLGGSEHARVAAEELANEREAVRALWHHVFGGSPFRPGSYCGSPFRAGSYIVGRPSGRLGSY